MLTPHEVALLFVATDAPERIPSCFWLRFTEFLHADEAALTQAFRKRGMLRI